MKIVLDFDDTIFNTSAFNEKLFNIFKEAGFSRKEYEINYQRSTEIKGDFDADFMIELFLQIKKINKNEIRKEINLIVNKSKDYIYKDFFDFAKNFNKKDLILVSVGVKYFQTSKIENAGIISFFNKINIPLKYKSEEINLIIKRSPGEKIFLIDDKAKQIDEAKKRFQQIVAIKMERLHGRHVLPKSKLTDYVVKDLDEAKNIINKLNK